MHSEHLLTAVTIEAGKRPLSSHARVLLLLTNDEGRLNCCVTTSQLMRRKAQIAECLLIGRLAC